MIASSTPPLHLDRRKAMLALGGIAMGHAGLASAQSHSQVKIILPLSAGSGVDAIARAASNQLGQALTSTVVIENLPGAGGVVGTQALVRAAPDGATLSLVSNNHVIYPSIIKSLPFDPIADITPITVVASSPMVLVTRPDFPANNLREFRDLLKANPGKYNFGSSGTGTILHLAAELFKDVTGTYSTHIPYRGTGPLMNDVMGGQVDWAVIALPAIRGAIEAGRVKALAVGTAQKVPGFEKLPTAVEQGFDKYVVDGWVAAVGPKGMPADMVNRVYAAFVQAFRSSEVKDAMAKQGNTVVLAPPDVTAKHFQNELQRYSQLVKRSAGMTQ